MLTESNSPSRPWIRGLLHHIMLPWHTFVLLVFPFPLFIAIINCLLVSLVPNNIRKHRLSSTYMCVHVYLKDLISDIKNLSLFSLNS